jgi:hypothetical protein
MSTGGEGGAARHGDRAESSPEQQGDGEDGRRAVQPFNRREGGRTTGGAAFEPARGRSPVVAGGRRRQRSLSAREKEKGGGGQELIARGVGGCL